MAESGYKKYIKVHITRGEGVLKNVWPLSVGFGDMTYSFCPFMVIGEVCERVDVLGGLV